MVQTESHAAKPIDGFLVLRAYACLLVLVNHVYGSLPPGSWHRLLLARGHNLSWAIHTPAWSGVWIFFTLSGYLMGKAFFTGRYALNRHGAGEFYHNRAWRIGPLYLLVVAISCLLQAPEVFYRENWTVLVRMLTFTYSAQSRVNPDGALWSISTEVQFFLLAPAMAWLAIKSVGRPGNNVSRWVGLALVAGGGLALREAVWRVALGRDVASWGSYLYHPIWMNLDLFAVGMLANCWTGPREPLPMTRLHRRIGPVLVLGGFVAFHIVIGYVSWRGFSLGRSATCRDLFIAVSPTATALFTCSVIVCIERMKKWYALTSPAISRSVIRRGCRTPMRALEHLGRLTYGIYCWHSLVLLCATMRIFPGDTIGVFFQRLAFTAAASIVLSELTYRLIELPAEAHKSQGSARGESIASPTTRDETSVLHPHISPARVAA